jgi:hypothetical protein
VNEKSQIPEIEYSRETIDQIVFAYESRTIQDIATQTNLSVTSIRDILTREGKYRRYVNQINIRDVATPIDWLKRVRSISDLSLRNWVGSIIFWDYDKENSCLLFKEFADNYDFNHRLSADDLVAALQSIGYPEPKRRIISKFKGDWREAVSSKTPKPCGKAGHNK